MEPNFPPRCSERYEPLRLLGRGGFGTVFLARDVRLDRLVAIKLLSADGDLDPVSVERFRAEAQLTSTISHPNVVRVLDSDVEDERAWIAYEFLPGPTLKRYVSRRAPSWREAIRIVADVAAGLDAAHARCILHRDVKPANILRGACGTWKLADFGIAELENADRGTADGVLLGTPAFLAPEILRGGRASVASDVYSLGVLLFQLLTSELPYGGASLGDLLDQCTSGARPRVSAVRRDAPRELDEVIEWALAANPRARCPAAAAFALRLRRILGRTGDSVRPARRLEELAEQSVFALRSGPQRREPAPKVTPVARALVAPALGG